MTVTYEIVWTESGSDIIEDVYVDGIEDIKTAQGLLHKINTNAIYDGQDWIPRILKVTEEFI